MKFCEDNNKNETISGDSGYPCEPWLITPYRDAVEGSLQAQFNRKHTKARNIVERTIGVLKSRFRCLLGARKLHYRPQKAVQIVNACCAIHNICIHYKASHCEAEIVEDLVPEINVRDIESNIFIDGASIRNNILRSLFGN